MAATEPQLIASDVPDFDEAADFGSAGNTPKAAQADHTVNFPRLLAVSPPALLHADRTWMAIQWPLPAVEMRGVLPAAYALHYRLLVQNVSDPSDPRGADIGSYQCCYEGSATTTEVTGLKPGRLYAVRVTYTLLPHFAPHAVADEQTSGPLWAATKACAPAGLAAPELTSRARNSLKLKWSPPREDGGRPIVAYTLYMRPPPIDFEAQLDSQGYMRAYEGPSLTHKVVRLKPGTSYQFRVQCCNMVGLSELSAPVTLITTASVPSTPKAPVLTDASADSVTLCWEPPHGNGEAVTSYVLEGDYGDGGDFHRVYNGDARECCVTKLEPGTRYRFRMAAVNAVGISLWSPVVLATTLLAPSKCPTHIKIISVNRRHVTLTWVAPGNTGGADQLSYEVELKPLSKVALVNGTRDSWQVVYHGAVTACTISSLKAGCKYQVRIRALTRVGYGEYCPTIDVVTSADVPEPPEAPWVVSTTSSSLHLAWAPPDHNGGAPLTAYAVQLQPNDTLPQQAMDPVIVYRGLELQCLVAELPPGQEYRFRVQAVNGQGASAWSPFAAGSTRAAAPAAPVLREQDISALSTMVELRWQEPRCPGARIIAYHVQLASALASRAVSGSVEAEGEGLVDSFSNFSDSSNEQLQPATPPNGPSWVGAPHSAQHGAAIGQSNGHLEGTLNASAAATSLNGSVTSAAGVSHSSKCADATAEVVQTLQPAQQLQAPGKGAIDDMASEAVHGPFTTAHQGPEPACTINGLQPYTRYWVRAKACNSFGSSPWSNVCVFHTAAAPPSAPNAVQAEGLSSSSVHLSWKEPLQQHGCPVNRYQVDVSPVPLRGKMSLQWQQCYLGEASSCTVAELDCGRTYCFRVRAANSKGFGDWGAPVHVCTLPGRPSAPEAPTFGQRTTNSVRVKWQPPEEDGGSPVTEYRLDYSSAQLDGFTTAYSGLDMQAKVANLSAGTVYHFRVQAVTSAGAGPFSEPATIKTALRPPPPPQNVTATLQGDAAEGRQPSLLVSWTAPEPSVDYAGMASYEIELHALRPSGALSQKQLLQIGARLTSHVVHSLEPGALYQMKMRCTGSDGAGAGEWGPLVHLKDPVPVPKRVSSGVELRRKGRSAAAKAVDVNVVSGTAHHARPLDKGVTVALAKPPPKKGWRQMLSKKNMRWLSSWVATIVLSAAGLALLFNTLKGQ